MICYSALMINRVILFVIDGFGIGALPDGADYGDADANTLTHLAETVDGLSLPNFEMLGLGHIAPASSIASVVFQSRMPPEAFTFARPATTSFNNRTSSTVAPPAPKPVDVFT